MMGNNKIGAMLLSVMMIMSAAGCAGTSAESSEETTTAAEAVLNQKSFTSLSADNVKLIGRTYSAEDGTLWLIQSASGVEFTFNGTSASVTFTGDKNAATQWGKDNYARYALYVDGERISDDIMTETSRTVEIFSSDAGKETTVKILKLSEAANSILGIKSIDVTSVGDIYPTSEKELKIEFIGDSITCGYGVDDEVKEHHFSTDTEDATKAYAYKTAMLLDADYSLVSFSGHGVISGYTSTQEPQTGQLVPSYYSKLGRCYSGGANGVDVDSIDWDFSAFTPDVVVINLGTNDDSYVKNKEDRTQEFIDGYVSFLGDVRSCNPDAYILCTLGIMGDTLYPAVETAVSEYTESSGDIRVSAMKFDVQNQADGYAADWHPTEKTHEKAAEKLAAEIRTIIG